MITQDSPFGIDVSRYQGIINWGVIAAHVPKVLFAGIRAGISWAYLDPQFATNWEGAGRVGIARTAYHVLYPGEDAGRQVDHFLNILNGDLGELPPVVDVELDHGYPYTVTQKTLHEYLLYFEAQTGIKPIVYSGKWFVDPNVTGVGKIPPVWYNDYYWWLADYGTNDGQHHDLTRIPEGVNVARVLIHQFTSKGAPFGIEGKSLDYNLWQFSLEHFLNFINKPEPPPNPSPDVDLVAIRNQVIVLRDEMNNLSDIIGEMAGGQ